MTSPIDPGITRMLRLAGGGDRQAADELLALVHDELHRLAAAMMRHQPAQHTLQTTALVHEAWLRLAGDGDDKATDRFVDRAHFFRFAAQAMRSVLVDHARRKAAAKRAAGGERLPLDAVLLAYEERALDVLAVHGALSELESLDPDLGKLVELRFFAGLTIAQTAEVLQLSTPTVERRWRAARALLQIHLSGDVDAS